MRILAAIGAALGLLAARAAARDVHGELDAIKTPGVSLAWAVARGPDEPRTFVVVRLRVAPGIEGVTVTGRDPFTKAEKVLQVAAAVNGRVEVRIPRTSFADHPRTEWQFKGSAKELPLTVFYLGVPDTTPEFADEKRLDGYLEDRLGKL